MVTGLGAPNQCTATSKRSGKRCERYALTGSNVCHMHGGRSPKGREHHNYKGRGYSVDIPTRLLDRYNASMNDPELLSVRSEIALLDARMGDLLRRVNSGESLESWKAASKANKQLRTAIAAGSQEGVQAALGELDDTLGRGLADYAAWTEIGNIVEHRRKLAESEQKRLVAMEMLVTGDQALLFGAALLDVVRRFVPDKRVRSQIAQEFNRLMNRQPAVHQVEAGDDGE